MIKKNVLLILTLLLMLSLVPDAQAASSASKAGAVTTSAGKLNVRSQPSSAAPVVATLNKGNYITLISKSGSWWKVEYGKNKYGYCHSDYITVVQGTPVTVNTKSGGLNVRTGPGTSHAKSAVLYKGETVLFLKHTDGWSRVLYHGIKTGYVSAAYLSNYYSAVSLNVPNFKQMDSRWANMEVGDSGKTMAQIGCATTAVAMMESHRTGTTIYPDAMEKQLSYTPTGNLYWPSHYRSSTSDSGYLRGIYSKLQQGRPVLLGVKNSYGSQHWVVVSGYGGGINLSASRFIIRDPGSNSRTNLQQLLNAYPSFYKYFYY